MSAGSFDCSGSDGKRRIAHSGAGSSDLIRSLNYKKESMGKLLSSTQKTFGAPKVFPVFLKRQRLTSDSENERTKDKRPKSAAEQLSAQTFCGKSFMTAVTHQNKGIRPTINSDSDGSNADGGWMSKSKMAADGGAKSGKLTAGSSSANGGAKAKRRAIMSSDEEEWDQNGAVSSDGDHDLDEEEERMPKRREKKHVAVGGVNSAGVASHRRNADFVIMKKKTKGRGRNISTGSEDDDDHLQDSDEEEDEDEEEEEVADTPSSSELSDEDNDLNPKKTLKELKQKALRVREHQRRKGQSTAELSDASDGAEEDGGEDGGRRRDSAGEDDDFDSDDSDAAERRDHRANRQRQVLEERCVEFINTATVDEMTQTQKFNERFANAMAERRPFRNFAHIKEECGTTVSRALQMLESYIEFLENRSMLDQVLDDCRRQSEEIKQELDRLGSGRSAVDKQPALLNPNCILHPYQQIGLQWLIMMNRLGLNAVLADEMGLGKTIQIIAFLAWSKEQPRMQFPHLIVVPSSTLENWMNEIAKWCPSLRLLTYYGSISDRARLRHRASSRNVDVILTTYNMIISRPEDRSFFKKFHINYVIYDEGHMLRSCNTMRYKNLMRVQGKRKILLTGTPLQNNLVELISLMFFTMPKLFTKYCDDISSLLQMFVRKGAALEQRGNGGDASKANKKLVSKRGGGRKSTADAQKEAEDVEAGERIDGDDDVQTKDENLENRPLYEQHKIVQAKRILHPFVLRRLKTNVLNSLPKKYESASLCEMSDVQEELYDEVLRDFREAKALGNANALGSLVQMRQVANHPLLYRRHYDDEKLYKIARILCAKESKYKGKKVDHVAEDLSYMLDIQIHSLCKKFSSLCAHELDPYMALNSGKCKQLDVLLPKIFDKGEKVLIFSQYTTLLDVLELYLEHRGHKFCRLDGSTPVMERQDLINQFNTEPSIKVFLLSTKAGGLGINLTAANNIIIHDIDLNPYNDKQAEDRCHRMGQTREVFVTRLISRNTIEESMLDLAQRKLELERHVTSGHEKSHKDDLDANTVEELLSRAIERRGD